MYRISYLWYIIYQNLLIYKIEFNFEFVMYRISYLWYIIYHKLAKKEVIKFRIKIETTVETVSFYCCIIILN